jgi:hypothetical protein
MEEMAAVSLAPWEIATTTEAHALPPPSGVRALMLAVLDDAINSLSSTESLVRAEAELWITNGEGRYVFSFLVICETLDLEPTLLRQSVTNLLRRKRSRGRLLRRTRPNVRHKGALQLATAHHH